MLFDVDRFKQINDTVGHQMGDEILKRVARVAADVATISVGLADALPEQDTLDQLIQRADRALYRAKAKGRNCTEVDLPVG
jgi:PleD family two-component response regulator